MISVSYSAGFGSLGELVFGKGQEFNCTGGLDLGPTNPTVDTVCFGSTTRTRDGVPIHQLFVRLQQLVNIVGQGLAALIRAGVDRFQAVRDFAVASFKPIAVDGFIGVKTLDAINNTSDAAATLRLPGSDSSLRGGNQVSMAKNVDQIVDDYTTLAAAVQGELQAAGLSTIATTAETALRPTTAATSTIDPVDDPSVVAPRIQPRSKLPLIIGGSLAAVAAVGVLSYALLHRRSVPAAATVGRRRRR